MKNILNIVIPIVLLFASGMTYASALPSQDQEKSVESKSVQTQVDQTSADKAASQREKITVEAVAAIEQTQKALQALNEGKTDEALKALEVATGKLELILARDPKLAFVPINVDMVTYDLFANVDTVKTAIKEVQDLLDNGKVQEARRLMSNLASEVVINTTSIPLATYPTAIKAISPLLDKGETDEAKLALQAALNTLVVTTEVVPLPLLRSQYMLVAAENLAEKEKRSEDDNQKLDNLLKAADEELKLAEVLGYGSKTDFEPLHKQISKIKDKSSGGKSGKGWFDELQAALKNLF